MRRARWKRKNVRDDLTPPCQLTKTGAGRHALPKKSGSLLPTALYLFLPELCPRTCGHRVQWGTKPNRRISTLVRSASLRTTRFASCFIFVAHPTPEGGSKGEPRPPSSVPLGDGFQRRGPRPPAFVSLGVQGEVETPWCFSSGVWGGFFSRKECAPRPCGGNRPLRE